MKVFLVHFIFLMSGHLSFSQVAVEILEEETADHVVFKARNTLDEPVEITFELSDVRGWNTMATHCKARGATKDPTGCRAQKEWRSHKLFIRLQPGPYARQALRPRGFQKV